MVKEEIVNIKGRDIKVRALSFIGRVELLGREKSESYLRKVIQVSISSEDFEYLNNLECELDEVNKVLDSINKLNGWNEKKEDGDVKVFQEPKSIESD